MKSGQSGSIVIERAYFEEDRRVHGRYWLWLRVRSDISGPAEVRLKVDDSARGKAFFVRGGRGRGSTISLGFHSLKEGLNELPPLPLFVSADDIESFIAVVDVRSRRRAERHRVFGPLISTPLMPAHASPYGNLLN